MSRDNLETTGDKSGLHGSQTSPTRLGVWGQHTTWDNIPSDMCFPCRGTHITGEYVFLGRGTYITIDVCFLGRGVHITRDM